MDNQLISQQLQARARSFADSPSVTELADIISQADKQNLVVQKQVVSVLVEVIRDASMQDAEVHKDAIIHLLDTLQGRSSSFEEQISTLRFKLADLLEAEEEWSEAARTLIAIPQDSTQRCVRRIEEL